MIGIGNRIGAIALAAASATICSTPSAIVWPMLITVWPRSDWIRGIDEKNRLTLAQTSTIDNIREIDSGKFHPFGGVIDRELLDRLQVYRTTMGRRKFVFASAIAVIMMLAGSISYFLLPVSQFPATTPPQVVVSAVYAGASAQVPPCAG